jgi:hypothetical protein
LVGALEHYFYDFSFSWECPTDELIFFRGVGTTNQMFFMMNGQLMILATWGSRRAGARSVQEYDELRRRQLIDSGGYTMEQMDTGLEM